MTSKHFEHLWEESENLSNSIYKEETTDKVISEIISLLNDFKEIDSSDNPIEIKKSVKNRYVGEIVFLLTALSYKDNINVYAALKEELILNATK